MTRLILLQIMWVFEDKNSQYGNKNHKNGLGCTPLHLSAVNDHFTVCMYVKKHDHLIG